MPKSSSNRTKENNLPRNQADDNHVVVLHETCLSTQFPLHKMYVNEYNGKPVMQSKRVDSFLSFFATMF